MSRWSAEDPDLSPEPMVHVRYNNPDLAPDSCQLCTCIAMHAQ